MGKGPRAESYRSLDTWEKSMRLASTIYAVTASWPDDERYGMTSQIRRAAFSIPSNVAEGHGRLGKAEMRHHLYIAHGSLCEVETLIYLAADLGMLDQERRDSFLADSAEVGSIVRGFIMSLDRRASTDGSRSSPAASRHLDTSTSRLADERRTQ